MSRVLLADDSPHAQRMGERILREEGFEVASVTDGQTALIRIRDVDPDLILLDAFLPQRSGFDICREIKDTQSLKFTSVVLTYGLTEVIDQKQVTQSGADAILQKPFESGALLEMIRPLVEKAQRRRKEPVGADAVEPKRSLIPVEAKPTTPVVKAAPEPVAFPILQATAPIKVTPEAANLETDEAVSLGSFDQERVRAAVTLALDAAMPQLIDELTAKVLLALKEY